MNMQCFVSMTFCILLFMVFLLLISSIVSFVSNFNFNYYSRKKSLENAGRLLTW